MLGSFSSKSLEMFSKLVMEIHSSGFSEPSDSYDFTRCVRPNGTAYGTSGKCKKGTEEILKELSAPVKKNFLHNLVKSVKVNQKVHLPSAPTDTLVALGNKISGSKSGNHEQELLNKVVDELSKRADYPTWRWEWWMHD